MDANTILSNLKRVRTLFDRKESFQAFKLIVITLPGVINMASIPVTVRSLLREALQILTKDELFKKYYPRGVIYQPGQERAIYNELKKVYQEAEIAQTIELRDATRRRKLSIDLHFGEGMKELANGKVAEADACFVKAVSFYQDEVRLFAVIGKALLEAKEVRRALVYLRKGTEFDPADLMLKELFADAVKQRQVV